MMTRLAITLPLLFLLLAGCTPERKPTNDDLVLLVPGVAGDGGGYTNLARAIERSTGAAIQRISWGAPAPLFMLNFSNRGIHDRAEAEVSKTIVERQKQFPNTSVDLIGHSAGCGVILGAIGRLPADSRIRTVVLLAPSVSPNYDLRSALAHIDRRLHVFISSNDTMFLKWRTGNFGTYDGIKAPAAGYAGFDLSTVPEELQQRIVVHSYDESWKNLDNDGGHFGALSEAFSETIIAPLFSHAAKDASPSR